MKKLVLVFVFIFIAGSIFAQDEMKPEKYSDVTWHNVVVVKFKPGKVDAAKEIIGKFKKAGDPENAPEMHWIKTGSYDLMMIWTMKGGPSYLEWKRTEEGIKWYAKLMEQNGGEEGAGKLMDEYFGLIKDNKSFITMKEKN